MRFRPPSIVTLLIVSLLAAPAVATGQQPTNETPQSNAASSDAAPASPDAASAEKEEPAPDDSGLIRISKEDAVWIHPQRRLVVVEGEIAFREGFLEMFACPRGTKEHESLVAVDSKAFVIHAALLAVGAKPGRPVQFNPTYRPAQGPIVDIFVLWRDEQGKKHTVRAQEWVRNTRTQEEMDQHWVFAGSGFWVDEETGKRYYYAEQGDLICLSNFTTATLDLPVESSQANGELLFEASTERVPPSGTKVRLVLIPRLEKNQQAEPEAK